MACGDGRNARARRRRRSNRQSLRRVQWQPGHHQRSARPARAREGINAAQRSAVETTAPECGGRADDKSGPGRKTRGGRNQAGLNSE